MAHSQRVAGYISKMTRDKLKGWPKSVMACILDVSDVDADGCFSLKRLLVDEQGAFGRC